MEIQGKRKIRIITQYGNDIERMAEIVDYVSNDGRQFSRAYVGRTVYVVDYHDTLGPVWRVEGR